MDGREQAIRIIEEIAKINMYRIPVIVEGKKDKASLETLGVKQIIMIQGKALYFVIDSLGDSRSVVILTDLDPEGKKIYGQLQHPCKQKGIKVENGLRNFLLKHTSISHIEGLARFIEHNIGA